MKKIIFALLIIMFFISCHHINKPLTQKATVDIVPKSTKNADTLLQLHTYPDILDEENILKAEISRGDSSFSVLGNIRKDYRIFGYEKPDTNSNRLILFSVFTRDVDHNPYNCRFGAYYQTSSMENAEIKYKAPAGSFISTDLLVKGIKVADLFFEKKWVEFSK